MTACTDNIMKSSACGLMHYLQNVGSWKVQFGLFRLMALAVLAPQLGYATAIPLQERQWGIGASVGSPGVGFNIKHRLNLREAIVIGAAWDCLCEKDYEIHLHTDYLLHDYRMFRGSAFQDQMAGYFGIGVGSSFDKDDDNTLGVRIPLGVVFEAYASRVDVFAEIVPGIEALPSTGLSVYASIGARFFL